MCPQGVDGITAPDLLSSQIDIIRAQEFTLAQVVRPFSAIRGNTAVSLWVKYLTVVHTLLNVAFHDVCRRSSSAVPDELMSRGPCAVRQFLAEGDP